MLFENKNIGGIVKLRQRWLFISVVLIVALYVPIGILAQEVTVTPLQPVFLQSADNRGFVTPLTIEQVMETTGIMHFRNDARDGFGIRIGVIDSAFGNLDIFEQNTNQDVSIPGEFDQAEYSNNIVTHGTDVLEIIHSLVPKAKLYACRYTDFSGFSRCIDYMLNQRVVIINHSAGVPILPLDGTNSWSTAVDNALNNAGYSVLWVNSSGNFARGFLSDQFTDVNTNGYHEFRGLGARIGEEIRFNESGYSGNIILSWQYIDDVSDSNVDLDLEIVDLNTGQIIAQAETRQTSLDAETSSYEVVSLTTDSPFGVRIRHFSGSVLGPVEIAVFVEFAVIQGAGTQGAVVSPADNPNVLTVGALQSNEPAPYSSRGTLRNDAFLPDLVAPGEIQLGDGRIFVGTSAAAPVVTSAAALIWEVFPDFSAQDVMNYLSDTATEDAGQPGRDIEYGDGRLRLPAISAGGSIPTPTVRCSLQVFANTKVRSGPGTNYQQTSTLAANAAVEALGVANGLDGFEWFYLGSGQWVRANTGDRIGNCGDLPQVNERGTPLNETNIDVITCPGAPPQILAMGARARQALAQDPVRVQNEPGGGTTLYLLQPGDIISINGGPRCHPLGNQPTTWWLVNSEKGPAGWVAEGTSSRYFWEILGG